MISLISSILVKNVDWQNIQWVYIETKIGQDLIGFVDDDDPINIYLHHSKIRDRKGKWIDYLDLLEKRDKFLSLTGHLKCLPIEKKQIKVIKEINPSYFSENDIGFF